MDDKFAHNYMLLKDLPGYKAGRRWYATQDDVNAAIERLRPRRIVPSVPVMTGLTRTSARRLSA